MATGHFVEHPHAQERTGKPQNRRNEAKRLGRLPLVALSTVLQPGPVKDATAINLVNVVDQDGEGGEPGGGEEEVDRVVHEGGGEGQEPDEAEHDGDDGDDHGVDFAAEGADGLRVVQMQKPGYDSHDDGGADELGEPQEEGEEA